MKIWFVNHYALPPSASGITRHHDLAARLGRRGFNVSIVAASFDHYSRTDRGTPGHGFTVEQVDGVRYCWVRTPAYGTGSAGRTRNMTEFARRLAAGWQRTGLPSPDVVVGSSPHLLAPLAARHVARRFGARFVMEVRDIWPESLVELGGPPRWHPAIVALGAVERSLYRSADVVVTLLPGAAAHIREHGGPDIDVEWIPNGAEVPASPPPPPPPDREGLEVVYAGTIGHANALDVVVDAAAHLEKHEPRSGIRWRIVGQGPDRGRLEGRATALGLTSLKFEGPVPKTLVSGVLADSDVCLLHLRESPVFRWGLSPNKLFDYMAAARPVIFAVSTELNAVQEAGAGVSLPPDDPVGLANAALRLRDTSPAERRSMALRGFEYLRQHHDLDRIADRYAELLRRGPGAAGVTSSAPLESR